jgi:serine phosphatase RsbU (regulator of sigma subunit)
MTLRRRLQIFVVLFGAITLSAALWERHVYNIARSEISAVVANSTELDEVAGQLSSALSFSVILSISLLVLAWIFLDRWVLNPLDEMRTELRLVASGTIHQIIEVANPPEIQLAAADAESMRRNLVEQIDQARAAWQGLEQDAPLVSSMRRALSPTEDQFLSELLDVYGHTQAADGVIAGDWWDVIRTPTGVAIALVDVTGHGPEAGIVGLQIKAVMTAALAAGFSASSVMDRVSAGLSDVEALLATAVIVDIPNELNTPVRWVSAGHPAGYLLIGAGKLHALNPTGPMLGGFGGHWSATEIALHPGQRIILASDGILETSDDSGADFGAEGLISAAICAPLDADSREMTNFITAQARQDSVTWSRDDVSLVVITRRLDS